MKVKNYLYFILVALFVSLFSACQVVSPSENSITESNGVTEISSQPIWDQENISSVFYDENSFLQHITTIEENISQNNNLTNGNTKSKTIPVPKLISQNYKFSFAEDNVESFVYYYVPSDYNRKDFDYSEGLVISISKLENSYNIWINQTNAIEKDGIACYSDTASDMLILNSNGVGVSIQFPKKLKILDSPTKIHEYFHFENYPIKCNQ